MTTWTCAPRRATPAAVILLLACGDPTGPGESNTRIAFAGDVVECNQFGCLPRSGILDIYTADPDGNDVTNVTNAPSQDRSPRWSPDGTQLAFVSDRDATGGGHDADIFVMNADGSGVVNVTGGALRLDAEFTLHEPWSPGGGWLLFAHHGIVYVARADGTRLIQLTAGEPPLLGASDPVWSPDGLRIVFSAGPLYVMGVDRENLVALTDENPTALGTILRTGAPTWSPDGTRIAFECDLSRTTGISGDLCVIPADGGSPQSIGEGRAPRWSPDGAHIVYVFIVPGGDPTTQGFRQKVIAVSGDGGSARQTVSLQDGVDDLQPAWSPSGSRLAFVSGTFGPVIGEVINTADPAFQVIWISDRDGDNLRMFSERHLGSSPDWRR